MLKNMGTMAKTVDWWHSRASLELTQSRQPDPTLDLMSSRCLKKVSKTFFELFKMENANLDFCQWKTAQLEPLIRLTTC
jgi:hypothetical protein